MMARASSRSSSTRRQRVETGWLRSSSSMAVPSDEARRRSPVAVRWYLRVRGVRSVAWGREPTRPDPTSLRTDP